MPQHINPMIVKTFRLEPHTVRAIEMIRRTIGRKNNSEVVRDAIEEYVNRHNLPFAGEDPALPDGEGEPLSVSLLGILSEEEEEE